MLKRLGTGALEAVVRKFQKNSILCFITSLRPIWNMQKYSDLKTRKTLLSR